MRVDSTMSACWPDASSQPTPPSGNRERSMLMPRSLQNANAIAELGRQLELLRLDGTPQPVFQLTQRHGTLQGFRHRRPILATYVTMIAVQPAQQLANTRRSEERRVGEECRSRW